MFRGLFTSFSADFITEIRGKGSEKSAKYGQFDIYFYLSRKIFGKLMHVKCENRSRLNDPLLKHQDTKPTLGCFWQHLWLAQLYPSAKETAKKTKTAKTE